MRDCWEIEILRLRAAALIRIFTRTFGLLCHWRCRNGRCLRSCLARSSRRASCKPVPRSSLQTFNQVCLCVWNSFHCPCRVHSHLVLEEMFIKFRGHAKPYSTDNSRICSTLPDSVSNLSTRKHGYTEQCCLRELHHLSLVRFPTAIFERCLLVAFHVIPPKQPSNMSHQPRPHVHGGCHFDRETCFQLETQASNLTFHCVLCSPNCTYALTAESWCCLNFELDSVCACSHCNLVCQQLQCGFWIDLQNSELLTHTPSV